VEDAVIYDLLKQNLESNEEGTEGARTDYLNGLAKRLKLTIKTAELFKRNAGPNAVMKVTWSDASIRGAQPKIKVGAVPATQGSVRKLVKLHQSAQDNTVMAARLNNEVVRLRHLSNKSGHYRPDVLNLVQVLAELQEGAIPFDFSVEQLNADKTSTRHDSADAFMRANHFDNRSYAAVLYAHRAIRNTAPIEDIPDEEFFEAAYEAAADEESANPYLTVEEFTYAPAT